MRAEVSKINTGKFRYKCLQIQTRMLDVVTQKRPIRRTNKSLCVIRWS